VDWARRSRQDLAVAFELHGHFSSTKE